MATLDTYRFRPQGRAPAPLRPGGTPNSRRDTRPAPASRVAAAPRKRTLAAERATSRACAPRRVGVVCASIGLAYLLLIGKLAYVQVGQHKHYVAEALRMRRKTIALSAPRGVMLDRNGTLLVQNEPAATIVVDPNLWGADLNKRKGETFEGRKANTLIHLQALLPGINVAGEIEKRCASPRITANGKAHFRPMDLARRVPVSVGEAVQAAIKSQGIIGVNVFSDTVRKAINGDLAPQIMGFTGQEGDGLDGLERVLDPSLFGKSGFVTAEFDKSKSPIPGTEFKRVEPRGGRDVVLTLDAALQHDVESALDKVFRLSQAEAAVAVVLDPKTGDILAMANRPTYNVNRRDPATIGGRMNRCVSAPYEPGSTLKVMTLSAALEEKLITPDARFYCGGGMGVGKYMIHCAHGARHGDETATDVIKNSCNIATAQIAFRLGKDKLYQYEKAFGFGDKTGAGLPGESRGLLSATDTWSNIKLANIGFGQGISVTPLQLAAAYAAIANNGTYLQPRIVWGQRNPATGELEPDKIAAGHFVVSPETAAAVRVMLQQVVDHGTGDKARLSSWTSGGKTGTAQIARGGHYNGKYVSSFVGMAPMNDPQFVILVAVTAPKGAYYGGVVAGPVFKEIAEKALMARRVAPDKIQFMDGNGDTHSQIKRVWSAANKPGVVDARKYAE